MKRRGEKRTAGFTLVELMIALVISGIVIGTMYSVGSASSRHFQVQHQSANMQSALRFAMIQVKRDLMRAGYLSTPRAQLNECTPSGMSNSVDSGGDGWIAGVSSFRNDVAPNLVDPTGFNAVNGFVHDQITLIGNYATSNEYPGVQMTSASSLTLNINPLTTWHSIQTDFGWAAANDTATVVVDPPRVQRAFPANGLIRIQTTTGQRHYATLNSAAQVVGNVIQMQFNPPMPGACMANANGGWIAPLQVIRYDAALTPPNDPIESERDGRQIPQLVRSQRLPRNKNNIMINTVSRSVLDYLAAFDLSFTMTQGMLLNQADSYQVGVRGASADNTNNQATVNLNPERIRAISLTLAARAASTDPGMRFYDCQDLRCFQLFPGPAGSQAARVRVLRADIFLPNIAYEGY